MNVEVASAIEFVELRRIPMEGATAETASTTLTTAELG